MKGENSFFLLLILLATHVDTGLFIVSTNTESTFCLATLHYRTCQSHMGFMSVLFSAHFGRDTKIVIELGLIATLRLQKYFHVWPGNVYDLGHINTLMSSSKRIDQKSKQTFLYALAKTHTINKLILRYFMFAKKRKKKYK